MFCYRQLGGRLHVPKSRGESIRTSTRARPEKWQRMSLDSESERDTDLTPYSSLFVALPASLRESYHRVARARRGRSTAPRAGSHKGRYWDRCAEKNAEYRRCESERECRSCGHPPAVPFQRSSVQWMPRNAPQRARPDDEYHAERRIEREHGVPRQQPDTPHGRRRPLVSG